MSASCTLEINGIDEVLRNLKNFTPRLKAALLLDAQNIAIQMESWAKDKAPWTDQTGHARDFIKQRVKWTSTNVLMVSLSHHAEYGVYLELCNEGKYAILEKALTEFAPEFESGWREIISSLV